MAPALELEAVSFRYRTGATLILEDFSLAIPSAQITALMGSSGSGKSTIAKIAAGIIHPSRGRAMRHIAFDRACDVVYVEQAPMNSVYPWLTVGANLTQPLQELGWSEHEIQKRLQFLAETFRIRHLLRSLPKEISGGELQRLALARNLTWRPRAAILDETLSSLDPTTRKLILAALRRIVSEDGVAVVVITHYPQDALDLADRVMVLGGTPAEIVDGFEVNLPWPRPLSSSAYDDLERRLGHSLRMVYEQVEIG